MPDAILFRKCRDLDITLHTATSLATTLDMRDVAGAVLSLGTMSTAATDAKKVLVPITKAVQCAYGNNKNV
jgi:hypothetical protein